MMKIPLILFVILSTSCSLLKQKNALSTLREDYTDLSRAICFELKAKARFELPGQKIVASIESLYEESTQKYIYEVRGGLGHQAQFSFKLRDNIFWPLNFEQINFDDGMTPKEKKEIYLLFRLWGHWLTFLADKRGDIQVDPKLLNVKIVDNSLNYSHVLIKSPYRLELKFSDILDEKKGQGAKKFAKLEMSYFKNNEFHSKVNLFLDSCFDPAVL